MNNLRVRVWAYRIWSGNLRRASRDYWGWISWDTAKVVARIVCGVKEQGDE